VPLSDDYGLGVDSVESGWLQIYDLILKVGDKYPRFAAVFFPLYRNSVQPLP
jgi:hypothetical protein